MNILQMIGLGAKKYGGLERYMVELARQVEANGDKLILVFNAYPKTEEYLQQLSKTNAEWVVISTNNKWAYFVDLCRILKKYKPAVVQTHFGNTISAVLIWLAGKLMGVKHQFGYQHCEPSVKPFRLRLAHNIVVSLGEKIFCVSGKSCEILQNAFPNQHNKLKTLYLGVEDFNYEKTLSRDKYALPKDKIIIGNVAYHNHVKGVDVLLDAVRVLRFDLGYENFIVCQIGGGQTGKDTELLYSKAQELGIDKFVCWMGIQNNVPEILSACDIYCQPSRSEGIPLSIMEASLAKLPVVASRVGGIPEVVTPENGYLVNAENAAELAASLAKLLENETLRIRMGEAGRKHALKNFYITTQVNRLIDEYYGK